MFGIAKKFVLFIDFVDETALTVTIRSDGSRLSATSTYSKIRQSGTETPTLETFRNFINFTFRNEDMFGSFFDALVSKLIPSDGNAEINGYSLITENRYSDDEYIDGLGASTGNTTFVVEVGTDPEVDAHA